MQHTVTLFRDTDRIHPKYHFGAWYVVERADDTIISERPVDMAQAALEGIDRKDWAIFVGLSVAKAYGASFAIDNYSVYHAMFGND